MPFAAAFFCLALMAHGAAKQTNATAKPASASPTTPAPTEIPRSVFVVPRSPKEGRDPFFPQSTRFSGTTVTDPKTRTNQPPVVLELALKGISGTRERPLAIINNQTFAAGEENEVITGTRRVRIRCIAINAEAETVIIEFGNERRELRLKQRK
jgi:hypothetical protein